MLKVGVHEQIRQISISPSGKWITLATSHTVHLALLPDSVHLGQLPNKPMKLKTWTIGRTTHVLSQSPLASVLWHPCGVSGNCLVTVTVDASIRLWEIDEENRWSSDHPSLAIDLKKLVLGTSAEENFAPERGKNRAFSSDSIGMEVASACFGGDNTVQESPWSSLTLWVAMKAGDVYALCPLLPSRWQPCSNLLQSLSTTIVAKTAASLGDDPSSSLNATDYRDQYRWIQELDDQDPVRAGTTSEPDGVAEIYKRPERIAAIPRLQGPFQLFSDEDLDTEISDIHVIGAKASSEDPAMLDDPSHDNDNTDDDGLSVNVVCLMTRSGRCFISLDVEGVEGQWLPPKKPKQKAIESSYSEPYLVVLEALDTLKAEEAERTEWPSFSVDVVSRYSFFTTHSQGVYFFSLEPWLQNLEKEIQSNDSAGTSFRLGVFRNGPSTLREQILSFNPASGNRSAPGVPGCVVLEDSDLGYFLLTTCDDQPQAATLDRPYSTLIPTLAPLEDEELDQTGVGGLALGPTRNSYQPPSVFYESSIIPSFLENHVQARHRHLVNQPVRLSPTTLDLMTQAHRVLSLETSQQGYAAADLFRRCERLVEELRDQISRVAECAERTERLMDKNPEDSNDSEEEVKTNSPGQSRLKYRLEKAQGRQTELRDRFDKLSKKLHSSGGKQLSEKEKGWISELKTQAKAVGIKPEDELGDVRLNHNQANGGDKDDEGHNKAEQDKRTQSKGSEDESSESESDSDEPLNEEQRKNRIHRLASKLLPQSRAVSSRQDQDSNIDNKSNSSDNEDGISDALRSEKVEQVKQLLEREYVRSFTLSTTCLHPIFHSSLRPIHSTLDRSATIGPLLPSLPLIRQSNKQANRVNLHRSTMIQAAQERLEKLLLSAGAAAAS